MSTMLKGKNKNDQRLSVGQSVPDRVFLTSSHRFRGSHMTRPYSRVIKKSKAKLNLYLYGFQRYLYKLFASYYLYS